MRIRIEPVDSAQPVTIILAAGQSMPPEFLRAVLEVFAQQGEGGGSLGFPLMKVKVTVLSGEFKEGESNELAFRRAAADAFKRPCKQPASCSWNRS